GPRSRANTIREPNRRRKPAPTAKSLASPPRIVFPFKSCIALPLVFAGRGEKLRDCVGRIRYDLVLTCIGDAEVDRTVAHVLDCRTAAPAIRGLLVGRSQLKCSRIAESPIPSSLVQRLQSSIMAWPEIFHAGISCVDLLK